MTKRPSAATVAILSAMHARQGRSITVAELITQTGVDPRVVRSIVARLRVRGYVIMLPLSEGQASNGYVLTVVGSLRAAELVNRDEGATDGC